MKRKEIARKHVETSAGLGVGMSRGGYTPHYMDEYQKKGLAKWIPWKCLKIRGIVGQG
jgi:hypothetical protein